MDEDQIPFFNSAHDVAIKFEMEQILFGGQNRG
jgi:hypothetical protein